MARRGVGAADSEAGEAGEMQAYRKMPQEEAAPALKSRVVWI